MMMKILYKQSYMYYKDSDLCQYFSTPQPIKDEGPILRLADLHIIPKNDIASNHHAKEQ